MGTQGTQGVPRAGAGREAGGRAAPRGSHKASLLSAALAQTRSSLALGPPEGPKVREDAEESCSKTSWRPPATGRPEKGPEAYVSNLKEQSQDPGDKKRERMLIRTPLYTQHLPPGPAVNSHYEGGN